MNRIKKLGRPKRAAPYHAEKVVCEALHTTSDLKILALESNPFARPNAQIGLV